MDRRPKTAKEPSARFRTVGDGSGLVGEDRFYREEVQLALRNRGTPPEVLRYPITPSGLHYVLVHYDIPHVELDSWRLTVGGLVERTLGLSLDQVRRRPARKITVTMECAGNGRSLMSPRAISQPWGTDAVSTAEWTGTSLASLLREAGLRPEAREIVFTGLDRGVERDVEQAYRRSLTIGDALYDDVILAYDMNGSPLPPQHGFPLRLVVPGWYGMASVKWLTGIEAVSEPFKGHQMTGAYRYSRSREDTGTPVQLIRVRALMAPPGIADFLTRARLVKAGPLVLEGRAWAGRSTVSMVEVSVDSGSRWDRANLDPPTSRHAWRGWKLDWSAKPGRHTLCVRATDDAGNVQPMEPVWNLGGYGNNAVQRVEVLVE